jgi:hypothetical protein
MMPLLQAFPYPSTLGAVTLHSLSQACMFIYSSREKWVFPSLLWSFPLTTTFTSFPALIAVVCCCSCWLVCLFTAHVGGGSFPLSCGVFLPPLLSQAFPPLVAGHSWLVYLQFWVGFPSPLLWCSGCPTLWYVSLLFLLLITQFLFFPWERVGLSRRLCLSGSGLSVGVLRTT